MNTFTVFVPSKFVNAVERELYQRGVFAEHLRVNESGEICANLDQVTNLGNLCQFHFQIAKPEVGPPFAKKPRGKRALAETVEVVEHEANPDQRIPDDTRLMQTPEEEVKTVEVKMVKEVATVRVAMTDDHDVEFSFSNDAHKALFISTVVNFIK